MLLDSFSFVVCELEKRAVTVARARNPLLGNFSFFVCELEHRAVTVVRARKSCCACSEGKKSVS